MRTEQEIRKKITHEKMWKSTDGKHAHESNHNFVKGFISALEWVLGEEP